MLFHLFAFSTVATFFCFVSGYLCEQYASGDFSEILFDTGIGFLFIIYASLVLAFFLHAALNISTEIRHYFSKTESLKRRLIFGHHKMTQIIQQHRQEKRQLHYRHEQMHHNLLSNNNKKHLRLLAESIGQNLVSIRNHLAKPTYRSYKKSLRSSYRTNNVKGLLKLHSQIQTIR